MNNTWDYIFSQLNTEINQTYALIQEEVNKGHIILPLYDDIFNAFKFTYPNKIKVVIFSQDPYQGYIKGTTIPISNGLAFSSKKDSPIQPSLKNIFKEITRTYPNSIFNSGDLTQWANQNILLLNSALTVNYNKSGSHKKFWIPFIIKIIQYICSLNPNIVFILMGNEVKKFDKYIQSNYILKVTHPSPIVPNNDFIGSNIFYNTNEILLSLGENPINWSIY